MLLMDITNKGFEALGLPLPYGNKGRGKTAHRHFAHWIKFHFEKKGHKVFLEWIVPGTNHPVDVAVQLQNAWSVFEICITSFDNAVSHIKACFEKPGVVDQLTLVVATKARLKELRKLVKSEFIFTVYADRIEFDVIADYVIKELKP